MQKLPDKVWPKTLKFCEIKFILTKLLCLNKHYRNLITSQNSRLFSIFLDKYALTKRLERSDIAARIDMITFLKQLECNMAMAKS